MRVHFLIPLLITIAPPFVHAQSLSFGGIFGANLSRDYSTFRFPQQIPPTPLLPGIDGFSQIASGPRHFIGGVMVEAGLTRRISIEADALYRPVSYRNSFVRADGSTLVSAEPIRTATWEFPILAKYRFALPIAPFVEAGVSLRPVGNGSNLSHTGFTAGAGVELHTHGVNIAPTVRYTRWSQYSTGPFAAKLDQPQLLVSIHHRAGSPGPTVFGRRLALGGVFGVGLGDDIRATSFFSIRHPESNTGIIGAMIEAEVFSNASIEVDGIYRPMHWTEAGFGNLRRRALLTWEFPILAKYRLPGRIVRPLIEAGPSFRVSGNLNDARPNWYGATAGVGVEARVRRFRMTPVIRYTRWARDRRLDENHTQTLPNRLQFVVGISFGDAP